MLKRLILFFMFALFTVVLPQCESDEQETVSQVKELDDFHEVIAEIWHDAYPSKNYDQLRKLLPDVNKLAQKVYDAKLPGILKDKKAKWDKGVGEFKASVDEYNAQVNGTDNEKLLLAAEDMHAKFEMLVRIIRPVSKEVDEFHKVLYKIYHYYLPEKDFKKISAVSKELLNKAEAMTKVKLSKRLEAKQAKYDAAVKDLVASVKKMNSALKNKSDKVKSDAVEAMHSNYQKVEGIFD